MQTATTIARYLLGLIFLVFGLNGFLHFIPMQAPTGTAAQFFAALYASGYLNVIFAFQIAPAIFLLINRYVPLALTVLAPIMVNILCFHICMEPKGLPIALIAAALWFVVFLGVRSAFAGLFQARVSA